MRLNGFRLALIVLSWYCVAFASAANQVSKAVPIEKEPRHKLILDNNQVRIFDVRIPAGDTSLYHTHLADSIFVTISAAELRSEEPGKPTVNLPLKTGDVAYGPHAKTPLTHRISNLGASEFRVLDIEIKAPSSSANAALGPLPAAYKPILENDRVRVSRLLLAPQATTGGDPHPVGRGVMIIVAASRTIIDIPPNRHSLIEFDPGDYYNRSQASTQRIRNGGTTPLEAINIELK